MWSRLPWLPAPYTSFAVIGTVVNACVHMHGATQLTHVLTAQAEAVPWSDTPHTAHNCGAYAVWHQHNRHTSLGEVRSQPPGRNVYRAGCCWRARMAVLAQAATRRGTWALVAAQLYITSPGDRALCSAAFFVGVRPLMMTTSWLRIPTTSTLWRRKVRRLPCKLRLPPSKRWMRHTSKAPPIWTNRCVHTASLPRPSHKCCTHCTYSSRWLAGRPCTSCST